MGTLARRVEIQPTPTQKRSLLQQHRKAYEWRVSEGKLYGCEIVAINPAYTSQKCSACGHTERGNRISQSEFRCLSCDHQINADLNAAINILEAGSCPDSLNACGEDVRPELLVRQISVKQESVVA